MELLKSFPRALILGVYLTHCSSASMSGHTPTSSNPPVTGDANHSDPGAAMPQAQAQTPPQPQPQPQSARATPATPAPAVAPATPSGTPPQTVANPTDNSNNAATNVLPSLTNTTSQSFVPCSSSYTIKAIANPYLAGVPAATSLTYQLSPGAGPIPTDVASAQGPVQVMPIGSTSCVQPGAVLYFAVNGRISHEGSYYSDANGNTEQIARHQLGAILGKSDIAAPINSLLGIFLSDADPSAAPAPGGLDFSSPVARDYVTLQPGIGQVFFIGTGVTSTGVYHQVTVPAGATRFYFAVMDTYQWNNNSGYVNGAIMVKK